MTEKWLPVYGYENLYEVSDKGRVRSLDRVVRCGPGTRVVKGQNMTLMKLTSGRHWCAQLSDGRGNNRKILVHHLVLEAFVCPRPDGMVGCHNNDDADDNTLENLRWDSQSQNMFDAVRNGRNVNANKTHCPQGHLLVPSPWEPGRRYCQECRKYVSRRHRERRKEIVRS